MTMITRGFGLSGKVKAITSIDVEIASSSITIEIAGDGGTSDMVYLKQGEAKSLRFNIEKADKCISVIDASISFMVKELKSDQAHLISKHTEDFDLSEAANGVIVLPLSKTDTDLEPASYVSELKVTFDENSIVKSEDIEFIVEESVF